MYVTWMAMQLFVAGRLLLAIVLTVAFCRLEIRVKALEEHERALYAAQHPEIAD